MVVQNRKTQRLYRKLGYTASAAATRRHWILNTPAHTERTQPSLTEDERAAVTVARQPVLPALPAPLRRVSPPDCSRPTWLT